MPQGRTWRTTNDNTRSYFYRSFFCRRNRRINPVYEVIWALAAAGFAAFLAFMERGAEKRSGADFRHYLMFSVLPVNIIALIVAAVRGAAEYKTWSAGTLIYVYNPLYPIGIAVGTIWITLAFIAINRLTRREA